MIIANSYPTRTCGIIVKSLYLTSLLSLQSSPPRSPTVTAVPKFSLLYRFILFSLHRMLPKARVVYCSATGVTDVKNMVGVE